MNQKQVLINLAAIANVLDEHKAYVYANSVTQVMKRVAQQHPWWQNEAGEPMYSPEAIRAEEAYVPEPDDILDNDRDDFDDGTGDMLAGRYEDIYNNWASYQEDLQAVDQKILDDKRNRHMQKGLEHLEKYKNHYSFMGEDEWMKKLEREMPNYVDFKDDVSELIFSPESIHRETYFEDPDTLHNILDAAKAAVINGTDMLAAINSVPAEGQHGSQYEGPEDLGWDGGRED